MNDLMWKFKDGKGLKDTEARVRWERCIIILNGLVASLSVSSNVPFKQWLRATLFYKRKRGSNKRKTNY